MTNAPYLRINDRVKLSERFCRLLDARGYPMTQLEGTVIDTWRFGLEQMVSVLWDDDHASRSMLAHNLIRSPRKLIDRQMAA